MVLHHVTKRPGCFVECSPTLHPNRLGHDQLHMIDIAPVPDRFENRVANPKNEQVLGSLLAKVVINSINLVFLENGRQLAVELAGGIQIMSNGFSIMTLRQRSFSSRNKPDSDNRLAIVAK